MTKEKNQLSIKKWSDYDHQQQNECNRDEKQKVKRTRILIEKEKKPLMTINHTLILVKDKTEDQYN